MFLVHSNKAYAYSNGLMGGDVPRLWWTSDQERNLAIYATLSSLTEFAIKGSPEMFARIAEANQYLQQEEAAAAASSSSKRRSKKGGGGQQQGSAQQPPQPPSPQKKKKKAVEPNPEWGFDSWVKMPYAVGPFPREKALKVRSEESNGWSESLDGEEQSRADSLDAAAKHKAWQAERAAAAAAEAGNRCVVVDFSWIGVVEKHCHF